MFLSIFYYVGNIAQRYFRNNDKSTLRSGAHPRAPYVDRNLGFRYAHFCANVPTFFRRKVKYRPFAKFNMSRALSILRQK